jgi:hypothetical protein
MTSLEFYQILLRDSIPKRAATEDVLVYMLILHTHQILLAAGSSLENVQLPAGQAAITLAPLTRTLTAEVIATLYPGDATRGRKDFWFTEYARQTPYECLADSPPEIKSQVLKVIKHLESHVMVAKLIED